MKRGISLALIASASMLSSAASAQDDDRYVRFGTTRQWFFASGIGLDLSNSSFDNSKSSTTTFTFTPGFDYFFGYHFSIGADLDVSVVHPTNGPDTSRVGGAARIGYAIPISRRVSLFPRLALGARSTWAKTVNTTSGLENDNRNTTGIVTLYVPFLFEVAPRFLLGVGPGFSRTFAGDTKDVTEVNVRFVVGMVLGGPSGAEAEPEERERFGDRHGVVFSGEENSSIAHSEVANSTSTTTTVTLRPGVDFFVVRHLSLGAFIDYSSNRSGEITTRSFATGPRVGYEVPLGRRFSFWPRADLAFGRATSDNDAPPPQNLGSASTATSGATTISLGLSAPFLLHAATHAFLGLGPYVRREVFRHYDAADQGLNGNDNTTFGLEFILGGWL